MRWCVRDTHFPRQCTPFLSISQSCSFLIEVRPQLNHIICRVYFYLGLWREFTGIFGEQTINCHEGKAKTTTKADASTSSAHQKDSTTQTSKAIEHEQTLPMARNSCNRSDWKDFRTRPNKATNLMYRLLSEHKNILKDESICPSRNFGWSGLDLGWHSRKAPLSIVRIPESMIQIAEEQVCCVRIGMMSNHFSIIVEVITSH